MLLGDKYIVENIQFCRAVLGQCYGVARMLGCVRVLLGCARVLLGC